MVLCVYPRLAPWAMALSSAFADLRSMWRFWMNRHPLTAPLSFAEIRGIDISRGPERITLTGMWSLL